MRTKKDKEKIIQDLKNKFQTSSGFALISILNLSTEKIEKLRNLAKEKNNLFQVVKKTLIYKANPNFVFSDEELKQPFGLLWVFDENGLGFKILNELKNEGIELELLGGYFLSSKFDKKSIWEIVNLPTKEELIAKFIGVFKSPLLKLDLSLSFPIKKLILTLSAIKKNN
ncbi:MAG: 50S ribosomal protein L10 [Patescibacteria group bacterium]